MRREDFAFHGQLRLFLPSDFKPAPRAWAPCPPDIRAKLQRLRAEIAAQVAARPKKVY